MANKFGVKKFNIKGKIEGISKEEIRAIFHACDVILQYHNVTSKYNTITVLLTDEDLGKTEYVKDGFKVVSTVVGRACIREGIIKVSTEVNTFTKFTTVSLHEMIHFYFEFPDECEEKLTSTLTGKLKPDVIRIANILVENTYKRAAYIAHTKISYKPKGNDFYDNEQYHNNHEKSTGIKYRSVVTVEAVQ